MSARPEPAAPILGDPVVIHGDKLRIRWIGADGWAELRRSFGSSGLRVFRPLDQLAWDPIVGVWRDRRVYS